MTLTILLMVMGFLFIKLFTLKAESKDEGTFISSQLDVFKPYWMNITHPEFELISGVNQSSTNKDFFSTEFNPVTTIGAKFGFFYNKDLEQNQNLSKFNKLLIYYDYYSSDWFNQSRREDYSINCYEFKFGIGKVSGYRYRIDSESYIILYNGGTMSWSETSYTGMLQNKNDSAYKKSELF